MPYLVPDVHLFYEPDNVQPKDHAGFAAVLPHLFADQRRWLHDAIGLA